MRSALAFFLIGGVSGVVALAGLMLIFMSHWGLRSIEGRPPDTFPVLFMQPGPRCSVILWRDLAEARGQATEWSHLVPTSDLAACQAQLPPGSSLEIQPASDGRQQIRLTISPGGDEVNPSRYLAASLAIEAISHQMYFGPGLALVALPPAGLFGGIVGALGAWRYRRRRAAV